MAVGFYCLPLYLAELPRNSNVTATEAALGTTIFLLLSSALSPVVAAGLRQWGLLPILLVGGGTGAASLALLGIAQDSTTAFVAYAGLATGTACAGLVPATAAIVETPGVSAERALVVGTLGMPIGGLVIAPVAGAAVDGIGFAAVCDALAAFFAVTVVVSVALLRSSARVQPQPAKTDPVTAATAPGSILTSRLFWKAFAIVSLILLTQNSALTTIVAVGVDRDIPAATLAITVVAGMSIAGRLAALPFVSAVSPVAFGAGIALVQVLTTVLLATAGSTVALLVSATFLGLTVANVIVMVPLLVASLVEPRAYAHFYGWVWCLAGIAASIGPAAIGLVRGATGTYTTPFLLLACGSLAAAAMLATGRLGPMLPRPASAEH